ncbi:MAG: hypothetical protein Q8K82_09950 [Gemmatimonadaceae bacterium]|nr:hypothetical protein [Gemmatimonadaceae bacterium]
MAADVLLLASLPFAVAGSVWLLAIHPKSKVARATTTIIMKTSDTTIASALKPRDRSP